MRITYYDTFDYRELKVKLKSVSDIKISYYDCFDDKTLVGKLKSAGTLYTEKRATLYADEFYKIINCTNLDFDKACEEIQSFFEGSTQIKNIRLNKLLTDPQKRPYAEELYLIAKLLKFKPIQLFNYFYGNGERPVVGV